MAAFTYNPISNNCMWGCLSFTSSLLSVYQSRCCCCHGKVWKRVTSCRLLDAAKLGLPGKVWQIQEKLRSVKFWAAKQGHKKRRLLVLFFFVWKFILVTSRPQNRRTQKERAQLTSPLQRPATMTHIIFHSWGLISIITWQWKTYSGVAFLNLMFHTRATPSGSWGASSLLL